MRFDEALVERLTRAAWEAEEIALFGKVTVPYNPDNNDTSMVRALLAELTKTHAVVPLENAPRPEVQWFAGEMERQLRSHDEKKGKDGWRDLPQGYLEQLLLSEVRELRTAIMLKRSAGEIVHEGADIGNVAMMIADNAKRDSACSPAKEVPTDVPHAH